MSENRSYLRGFLPYALAAALIGLVGGFSSVLGPAFMQAHGLADRNTTWTTLAQAVSTAACAPILGRLGDLLGRRVTLLLGLAVFALGNLLTAAADSLPFLLVARFIVGLGTAAVTPVILSYIVSEFPEGRTAGGFSLYMLLSGVSVVFGPSLGALLVAARGWQVMQWLCVALCAVTFVLCLIFGRRERRVRRPLERFDLPGALLVPLFFGLLLCIPSFGQNFGWKSPLFFAVLSGAAIALGTLLFAEHRAKAPILSGRFLRRRALIFSVLALFFTQGLMQANMTNTIVFVRNTLPQSAVSGYAVSVMYLGLSLGAVLLGPLADRVRQKSVLLGCVLLTGAGCALMLGFSRTTPAALLMASLGLVGFGLGGSGTIFLKVVLSGLDAREAGTGAGSYAVFRDLSAPFGVAVLVPLFTNRVSALCERGATQAEASVDAMHLLAAVELFCILGGLVCVLCLPNPKRKEEAI